MIDLQNVKKVYATRRGANEVLREVNLRIMPGEKLGILGRNGAGKSTMIRLISGAERPTSGRIERSMSVSWPLAFGGAFQGALTGLDNLRFICRIHGAKTDGAVEFVQEFSELGDFLWEPVRTYSSGMRARLAFAISMIVEFDCFLIDEIVSVGDARFHNKCHIELFEKRAERAMVIVSHDVNYIREHCKRVAVLDRGRLVVFGDVEDAAHHYHELMN